MKKGQKYSRKGKPHTVMKVDNAQEIVWVYVLDDELEDTLDNRVCFGKKVFEENFKLIKGEADE